MPSRFSGDKVRAQGGILDLSSDAKTLSTVEVERGEFVEVLIDVPRYENPLHVPLAVVRWSCDKELGWSLFKENRTTSGSRVK
jgi:hypothetical protein